jgi:hypothetical protein
MSNYTEEIDTDQEDDFETEDRTPANLRRAANQAKKLKAELDSLKRELAFTKAGLPFDDPKINYFVKGYEGDLNPETIRKAALEAGFLASQEQEAAVEQEAPNPNLQSEQRVMQASAGAMTEDISEEAAIARLQAAMEEGGIEAMLDVARQYGIPTTLD